MRYIDTGMLFGNAAVRSISLLLLSSFSAAFGAARDTVYSLPVGSPNVSTVTQQDFYRIPNEIAALYQDEVSRAGYTLVMELDWKIPYFGAGSKMIDGAFSIMIWGGLARNPSMTPDALAFVACHEVGHAVGGEPRQTEPLPTWASSEGQADYFAASVCMRNYFMGQDSVAALTGIAVDSQIKRQCLSTYRDRQEAAVCIRIAMAGKAVMDVIESMAAQPKRVSVSKPDRTVVKETLINNYPSSQCRLDTIVAGALSRARPACWFKVSDAAF